MSDKKSVKKTENNCNLPGPGPGRPKGSTNKFTNLKKAFLRVFDDLNGAEGLYEWASKNDRNRAMFYQWITKMLPSSVVGDQDDRGEFRPINVVINSNGAKAENDNVTPASGEGVEE